MLLSTLLQRVYDKLGQTEIRLCTGGSVSTAIDTTLDDKYGDDDDALVGGTAIVTFDSAGTSVAPENEFSKITGYVESTETITFSPAVSTAIAAGDKIMICRPRFPLYTMIELVNSALTSLGRIVLTDATTTIAASQTEYALPVACKQGRPLRVELQGVTTDANDNQWEKIDDYDIVPAAGGSTGLIIFKKQYPTGHSVKIWYRAVHPAVNVYNSYINETIPEELITTMTALRAVEWYNTKVSGSEDFWLQKESQLRAELSENRMMFSIWEPNRDDKMFSVSSLTPSGDDFTWPDPA